MSHAVNTSALADINVAAILDARQGLTGSAQANRRILSAEQEAYRLIEGREEDADDVAERLRREVQALRRHLRELCDAYELVVEPVGCTEAELAYAGLEWEADEPDWDKYPTVAKLALVGGGR